MDLTIKNKSKLSAKAKAISQAVIDALKDFCKQNAEFAQAVEQSDKTIEECLESCVKGVGNSISDIEVYKKAVKFYFPGADIKCVMTLDLGDGGYSNNTEQLSLSLDSLLDF